jgi:RNA polymerase sigma-70 factor, ECF subfamily
MGQRSLRRPHDRRVAAPPDAPPDQADATGREDRRMLRTTDRAALQQLARDQLPGLYALARNLAGQDAEDLVQEALVRACRSFRTLRDRAAGPRWLRVILTNVWRDRLRADGRNPDEVPVGEEERFSLYATLVEEDPLPYSDTLHVDFLGAFSRADVHLVLRRLPPHERAPLVLRYVEGFDTKEVAAMLELPLGTVLSQLHRGRNRFERELWAYAEESGLVPGPAASAQGGRR